MYHLRKNGEKYIFAFFCYLAASPLFNMETRVILAHLEHYSFAWESKNNEDFCEAPNCGGIYSVLLDLLDFLSLRCC
jgi:hypothetical protein